MLGIITEVAMRILLAVGLAVLIPIMALILLLLTPVGVIAALLGKVEYSTTKT